MEWNKKIHNEKNTTKTNLDMSYSTESNYAAIPFLNVIEFGVIALKLSTIQSGDSITLNRSYHFDSGYIRSHFISDIELKTQTIETKPNKRLTWLIDFDKEEKTRANKLKIDQQKKNEINKNWRAKTDMR